MDTDDAFDLYDDLDDALIQPLDKEIEKAKVEEQQKLQSANDQIEKWKKLQDDYEKLQLAHLQVQKNMSILTVTAKKEVNRKDELIRQLRSERDTLIFRRSKTTVSKSTQTPEELPKATYREHRLQLEQNKNGDREHTHSHDKYEKHQGKDRNNEHFDGKNEQHEKVIRRSRDRSREEEKSKSSSRENERDRSTRKDDRFIRDDKSSRTEKRHSSTEDAKISKSHKRSRSNDRRSGSDENKRRRYEEPKTIREKSPKHEKIHEKSQDHKKESDLRQKLLKKQVFEKKNEPKPRRESPRKKLPTVTEELEAEKMRLVRLLDLDAATKLYKPEVLHNKPNQSRSDKHETDSVAKKTKIVVKLKDPDTSKLLEFIHSSERSENETEKKTSVDPFDQLSAVIGKTLGKKEKLQAESSKSKHSKSHSDLKTVKAHKEPERQSKPNKSADSQPLDMSSNCVSQISYEEHEKSSKTSSKSEKKREPDQDVGVKKEKEKSKRESPRKKEKKKLNDEKVNVNQKKDAEPKVSEIPKESKTELENKKVTAQEKLTVGSTQPASEKNQPFTPVETKITKVSMPGNSPPAESTKVEADPSNDKKSVAETETAANGINSNYNSLDDSPVASPNVSNSDEIKETAAALNALSNEKDFPFFSPMKLPDNFVAFNSSNPSANASLISLSALDVSEMSIDEPKSDASQPNETIDEPKLEVEQPNESVVEKLAALTQVPPMETSSPKIELENSPGSKENSLNLTQESTKTKKRSSFQKDYAEDGSIVFTFARATKKKKKQK